MIFKAVWPFLNSIYQTQYKILSRTHRIDRLGNRNGENLGLDFWKGVISKKAQSTEFESYPESYRDIEEF